eukprot:3027027-Rhodomonas_salina.3
MVNWVPGYPGRRRHHKTRQGLTETQDHITLKLHRLCLALAEVPWYPGTSAQNAFGNLEWPRAKLLPG